MQRSNLVNTLSFSVYQNTSHRERAMFFKGAIFSKQHQLYRNESSHLKQLLLRRKNFFRIPNCLEQLLLSKNYFLVANTFSNQLLLEDKYFFLHSHCFEGAFFQNKQTFRICTFLKQVLLPNSYFSRRETFLVASISWKESIFSSSSAYPILKHLYLKILSISQHSFL